MRHHRPTSHANRLTSYTSRLTSYVQVVPSKPDKRNALSRFSATAIGFAFFLCLPSPASAQTANSGAPVSQNPTGGVTSKIVDTADLAKTLAAGGTDANTTGTTTVRANVASAATNGVAATTAPPSVLGTDLVRVLPTSTVVRPPATTKKPRTKSVKTSTATSTVVISPVMASTAQPPNALASTSDPMETAFAGLRKCESGGRYNLNTGNGYYGAYQFSPTTWSRLGFAGLPHEASPATQDAAARKLQAKAGWGQWPACSRKLGLL
jgi:Transglycosylase-like domain